MLTFHEFMKDPQRALHEITRKTVQHVIDWLAEQDALGFGNIFGDAKYRIVLPYVSPEMRAMKQRLESLPQGYKVDLEKGTATQTVQTQQGPKERVMRLGKVVELNGTDEEKKIYNQQGGGYSIVVSRHPIDVLRMSDFAHIQSCHSEGGSYFACAMEEAQGHGPIAYLVNTEDLKRVKDLQAEEIFADPERGVDGIQPVLRHRLRKYVSKSDDDVQLAIPDGRTYGVSYDNQNGPLAKSFRASLRDGMMARQKPLIDELGGRPRMKDFTRYGGSYIDSGVTDGGLFNSFFGDKQDSGMADYEGGENGTAAIAAQYEAEIEEIRQEYNFKNPVYGDASVEDMGEHVYVSVYGSVTVSFSTKMLARPLPRWNDHSDEAYKAWRALNGAIEDAVEKLRHSGIEEVEISVDGDSIDVRMSIPNHDGDGGPDEFRDMMSTLEDYDNDYDKVVGAVYSAMYGLGYVQQPYGYDINERQPRFNNFNVEHEDYMTWIESDGLKIGNIKGLSIPGMDRYSGSVRENVPGYKEFKDEMRKLWQAEAQRQIDTRASDPQRYFQGMEPEPVKDVKFPPPEITLTMNRQDDIFLFVQFAFPGTIPHDQAKAMEAHIRYLDTRVHVLAAYAQELLERLVLEPQRKKGMPTR